ncbi:type IV secretion system protein [Bartonella vinsonii]|uniref:TrwI protein n=1 Tax=Bartonella vinsonii subsp. berkhoffii str. Tweed TaxID=1094502 RepID=N6VH12_BARVB|nr:type IV secretion system protein [Bartonella vinsonii]ENN93040.1 TrwI protein [Bartonella vinsonii subsp. berkhoffii str. Tweed]
MDFKMFTQLFNHIDQATKTYVMDISSKAIATITPFVSIGLTIAFIVYGWLVIRGAVDMPISGFINRCLGISIITSIALTAGLYQKDIANVIINIPQDLSNKLLNNPPNNNQLISLIDKVALSGFERASEAFEESAFLDANGLLYGLFGILILLATSFLVAIGGAFILMAKIALVLLVGLGPLFIITLLWQPTYRFFEQWITQILSYTILIVLLATVFSFMMNIFANYMIDLKFDGQQNVSYALGGALILSIISIVLLLKLSSIANALAKGVTFGHLWR